MAIITFNNQTINTAEVSSVSSVSLNSNGKYQFTIFLSGVVIKSAEFTTEAMATNARVVAVNNINNRYFFKRITTTDPVYNVDVYDEVILANTENNDITVNLPTPSSLLDGTVFIVKKIDDSTGSTVTVKSSSGDIDGTIGTTGVVINTVYTSYTFLCDGTNYWII